MKTNMTSAQRAECVRWLTTMSTHSINAELIHGPFEVAAVKPLDDGWYVSTRGPSSGSGGWYETRDAALAHAYRVTGAPEPELTLFDLDSDCGCPCGHEGPTP